MMRMLPLAALLLLCACARQENAPAPAAPPAPTTAANAPAATPAPPAATPAPPAAAAQSETTQQATGSQESADAETDRPARSDASLEQMTSLPAAAQLPDGPWQPGVNYTPVVPAQPTSVEPGKVEVLEVFWLACPHCYALEPFVQNWLKSKPAYVTFVRVPVIWQPVHRAHAHLYYTLEALGRDDLVAKAFDTIQQQRVPLFDNSEDDSFKAQQKFATQNGVSAADFAKAYNSFTVNSNMQRAEQLTQRYRVEGVPLVVVNGKYTTDIAKAGGEAQLMKLVGDLAAAEHRH
jgi:protein dithiol oxidoreductase (disulfide-forming)